MGESLRRGIWRNVWNPSESRASSNVIMAVVVIPIVNAPFTNIMIKWAMRMILILFFRPVLASPTTCITLKIRPLVLWVNSPQIIIIMWSAEIQGSFSCARPVARWIRVIQVMHLMDIMVFVGSQVLVYSCRLDGYASEFVEFKLWRAHMGTLQPNWDWSLATRVKIHSGANPMSIRAGVMGGYRLASLNLSFFVFQNTPSVNWTISIRRTRCRMPVEHSLKHVTWIAIGQRCSKRWFQKLRWGSTGKKYVVLSTEISTDCWVHFP